MFILRDKDGFMHPMLPIWDEKSKSLILKPNYRDTIDWIVNEFDEKDKIKEKQGTLEKYMPQIVLAIVFIFAFMSMYYNWQHEKEQINRIDSKAVELQDMITRAKQQYDPVILQKAMQIIAGQQARTSTENWTNTIIHVNT